MFANAHMQRHFAKERDAEALRLATGAAMIENIRAAAAMRTQEITHVFDDAEHRDIDLA